VKANALQPVFVGFMPADLDEGHLYVSMEYATTIHLCACGCGNKVVLPLSPGDWRLLFDGDAISMVPSVGNWEFPCQSHYWIRDNQVIWSKPWTKAQIEAGRARDSGALNDYFAGRAATATAAVEETPVSPVAAPGWWTRLKRLFSGDND
jgi:hypothetical protein